MAFKSREIQHEQAALGFPFFPNKSLFTFCDVVCREFEFAYLNYLLSLVLVFNPDLQMNAFARASQLVFRKTVKKSNRADIFIATDKV